jgi:hypothetical protein
MRGHTKRRTGLHPLARLISPVGFLTIAAALAAVYLLLHLLGGREHVGFLCGSLPSGDAGPWQLTKGALYLLAYFGFVLAVPVLVLAAGIFSALLRLPGRGKLERGRRGRLARER